MHLYHLSVTRRRTAHAYTRQELLDMDIPQALCDRWSSYVQVKEPAFVMIAVEEREQRQRLEELNILNLPHSILIGRPDDLQYEQRMLEEKHAELQAGDWIQVQLPQGRNGRAAFRYYNRHLYRSYEVPGTYFKALAQQEGGVAASFQERFAAQKNRLLYQQQSVDQALNHISAEQRSAFKRDFVDTFVEGRSVFLARWL